VDTVQAVSLLLGASWAAGLNLYAAMLVLGYLNGAGHVVLPPVLQVLSDPLVMFAAGAMYMVEFFTDKTPGIDTGWDTLHTFIRIPAGALLAAGMSQALSVGPAAELAGLILGGSLAATSHAAKAGTRVLINTSPEPFSNWAASITEDVAVVAGLWTALHNPALFLGLLVLFLLIVAWLLPRIWGGLKRIAAKVGGWIGTGRRGTQPAGVDGYRVKGGGAIDTIDRDRSPPAL
jgi:hypothetical protein